jgi:hypothetical protein
MATKTAWRRWGRGSCEGYSLAFGGVRGLRGDVVRKAVGLGEPEVWRATIDCFEKTFPDRDTAMSYVEHELRAAMQQIILDWSSYCSLRGKGP